MATRDLRSYFTSVSKEKKASHGSCTSIPRLVKATGNVAAADASAVNAELESFSKKKERQSSSYNTNIPSRVKEEVGKYAHTYGTQGAIKRFKSKYPHYTFLRTTINNWKRNFFAKIFQKANISYPLIRTCTCTYQRVRNVSFSENFPNILNE